jgi:hypothetical protein
MTWRVIVQINFTGRGPHTQLYNPVAKYLTSCGLKPSGAIATWEGRAVSAVEVAKQFAKVLDLLSDPAKSGVCSAPLK